MNIRRYPKPEWYIAHVKRKRPRGPLGIDLVRTACAYQGIAYDDFMSPTRTALNSVTRQAVVYVLKRRRRDLSWPQIAKIVGRKDHTTVMHAFAVAERTCENNPDLASLVMKLEAVG